jgi:hypothetical protein
VILRPRIVNVSKMGALNLLGPVFFPTRVRRLRNISVKPITFRWQTTTDRLRPDSSSYSLSGAFEGWQASKCAKGDKG